MNVGAVRSHPRIVQTAEAQLQAAGFEILSVTPVAINFAGPPDLFEKAFHTRIQEKEVELARGATTTCLDSPDTDVLGLISTAGTPFAGIIEGVALEVPRYFFSESPLPATTDYWHMQVPRDVAIASRAAQVHQYGITGQGVRVAMVDSGWYRHAFFGAQGYTVAPVVLAPGASDPDADESGHGTGESANILAIAPGCELIPVKMNFVNTIAAFDTAVALQPDIITCSWGSNSPFELSAADMVLAASVAAAVASGITVIFAAGNGHAGFPGQHPDVISAGGVFMESDGSLQASNYSSAFSSQIYPGRQVPDVCGLVGMRPKAIYIMLPVQPGDNIDAGNSGSVFPDGDQTAPDDGWAAFSGTSAAAPQLAGVAALIKQVAPTITPALLKAVLTYTARDVVDGFSGAVSPFHTGLPAAPGPDEATGVGLVDAYSAVLTAYWVTTGAGLLYGYWPWAVI
ncbi:MAG TPA: S8 family serine peptidase [Candidatus Tectomicrobia bacterium]|nr:S8 family serine peptidase [Candidatus Tectomicrobia bacterium]